MNTQPYIISVDWFQVTCTSHSDFEISEGIFLQGGQVPDHNVRALYEVARGREFNSIYEHCLAILFHGFQLATIYFKPRPSSLPKSMCSIKVANRLLYSANWAWYLQDIAQALHWEIKNIGRADVCCDFVSFSGGLSPYEFIRRYLNSGEPSETNPSYVRVGSNKYTTMGEKKTSCKVVGGLSRTSCQHEVDYLRFGKRSSGVSVYLYCKSKELAEVHDKPYITDLWVKGGLLKVDPGQSSSEDSSEVPPIFRLEISINSGGLNVKREKTSEGKNEVRTAISMLARHVRPLEVSTLAVSDFGCQSSIENLFWAYANKYFRFKEVSHQRYKQYWPDVRLFDVSFSPSLRPYSISRSFGSGVAERNAIHTLQKLFFEVRSLSLPEMVTVDKSISILERYSHLKSQSINEPDVINLISALKAGHSWDEIKRMSIVSSRHLEQMKRLIWESVYHELRNVLCDSDVARAVDQYEMELAMAREQDELFRDFYQSNPSQP